MLGVDYGRRRIGLALSDADAVLARPWQTLAAGASPKVSASLVAAALTAFARETLGEEPLAAIVVGLPRRLSGEDNDQTAVTHQFADHLARLTGLPVHFQDERLTSREAESRLSVHERDWRKRKAKIDAMAAAIILQDFLDHRAVQAPPASTS
jgi:putative holliday junction resolvase